MIKRLLAASAMLIAASGMTMADAPAVNWTGCYVGVGLGVASTTNNASIDISGGPSLLAVDGLGSNGAQFGGHIGCDMQVAKGFVVGAWGSYDWHDQEWLITSGLIGTPIASMSIDSQWAIGGRAGVVVNNVLVYGLIGYTQMETSGVRVPIAATTLAVSDFSGMVFGGGMEMSLGGNLFLAGEYRYSRFDREQATIIPGILNLNLEPDMHAVSARLSYRFGVPGMAP